MNKVKEYLQNKTVGFWFMAASALFIVLAVIMALVSCSAPNGAYKILNQELMVVLSILSIVLIGATIVLADFRGDQWYIGALTAVIAVLICYCVYILFNGKIDVMGTVWFSELDQGNKVAIAALNNGVVGMVFYILSCISLAIGTAFNLGKKN